MKANYFKCLFCTFCVMVISSVSFPAVAQLDQTAKTDKYIEMLQSPGLKTRIDAAKHITRAGITDPRLYNIINEKLLSEYSLKTSNSKHIDEMSWMCKALAASGSETYAPTLEKIIETTGSDKLKRYAKQSLSLIPDYAEKNKLLNDTANSDPSLSPKANQYINMLRSDNASLKRDAAKSIYRQHLTEKKLFDVLNEELLKGYQLKSSKNNNYTDALSWMCKALGSSGMAEYQQTLTEIVENSSDPKLQKYARQGLGMLQ